MIDYKLVSINSLKPFKGNSRKHSAGQIAQVAKSIKEFGFTSPILVDEEYVILAGHARLEAAQMIGLLEVPVLKIEGLSSDQKKAYVIADNKIALNSDWDLDLLKKEVSDLIDVDFDISITGFSGEEIDALFSDEINIETADDDEVLDLPKEAVTKPGDLWILGEHRLLCGSSTEQDSYDKVVGSLSPNLMVTDPPYGVNYDSSWRADARGSNKSEKEKTAIIKNDDVADWYDAYVIFQGAVAYVWHASAFTDVVMDGLRRAGFEIKQQIIWNKNIHALSRSDYHWKHEPCWYAVKKDGDRNWVGGRDKMTVWDIQNSMFETDKTEHPTQKPVEIYARSILNHTKINDYVYDPFAGSGTLMAACEKTKRRALMIELDPKFCDVIITRYEKLTNTKARLAQS